MADAIQDCFSRAPAVVDGGSGDGVTSWRSTKLWYSVVLQVLTTVLLMMKILASSEWMIVTMSIYGAYVVGNVGAMAFGTGSVSRR